MIDFTKYDIVHCGLSGGKDSQAAATWLRFDSGIDLSKLVFSFCDTGNEHQWTYEHIDRIENWLGVEINRLHPDLDFYQLAEKKGRFPSAKARFCTEYLKMQVSQKIVLAWMKEDKNVLLVTGVRKQESADRSELKSFDFDTYYACDVYRPLVDWKIEQVFAYLGEKGQYPNPLYSLGAARVGCFPCIMSRKHEIRMIADNFPERIDKIREWENKIGEGSSFFDMNYAPKRFRRSPITRGGNTWMVAKIDDIVDWSHTKRGGKEYNSGPQLSFLELAPTCANNNGMCE